MERSETQISSEALAEAERLEKEIHENYVLDVYQEKLWKKK